MLDISLPDTGVGDITGGTVEDWLVVGWFTEDTTYRPLAEAFAANLAAHGVSFHLFSKPSLGAWNTRRKPSVVMEAMDAYPGKTVVLMDVDCLLQGDMEPVTRVRGDVGIVVIARNMRKGKRWAHWLAVECSSRVVVFNPTEKARAFAQTWADTIERSDVNHDEHSMAWAYLSSPSVDFDYIAQEYSGRELGSLPGAVIVHDSAHDEQRRAERGRFKTALRAFERRFLRTGLTRQSRLKGEMSVLIRSS
jgi:hypothetical protein